MDSFRKPSEKEEEFFLREELKRLKKLKEKKMQAMKEEEKKRLKELHWMHCPKCGMEMDEITFRGVKIDQCSACGGIYLDKGELDLLLSKEDASWLSQLFRLLK